MKKTRKNFLPFCLPEIGQEEIDEVIATLKSGWLTAGPRTKRFEDEFKHYIGSKHALAVNSCTNGLHLCLIVSKIEEGDAVITSPYTFAATGEVIIQTGATPIFIDIDLTNFNINPEKVEHFIEENFIYDDKQKCFVENKGGKRLKAIMPVHIAGHPCDMDNILRIAKRYNLIVIEDAAHAFPASYRNKHIGNIGDFTVFSFYVTKNITTSEGGIITTNKSRLAEKIKRLSLHGISKNAWLRYSDKGTWYYEILDAGYKYNMTDIQAALGLVQLKRIDSLQRRREEIVKLYNQAFSSISELILPQSSPGIKHAWHLYIIRLRKELLKINRAEFIEKMRRENIGCSVHFIPLHLHPLYKRRYGYRKGDFPNAEITYESVVSLPLYSGMSDEDVKDVCQAVERIISKSLR